ncbi:uncharacterized protein AMSG_10947 [Thecamonas trahens ATCC 50062]|uniref:Uncharacterized protein n=1 Tax=Thecamonas trahens ATCC 50062 TaxID=461836 RepID=A0A0L0DSQ9_THETB|nr:hypothetical protein AMSG_10947 [Thecamonas trahens ATCC 50062]KNC55305.1 hypothetical protein AMSG_10947 [Thecamonas trahens ATCC 50062]|eukprot:XP_013753125.1 hypothetical protein AMSG_10947 [Thecamonas trahens ATCC 50062]
MRASQTKIGFMLRSAARDGDCEAFLFLWQQAGAAAQTLRYPRDEGPLFPALASRHDAMIDMLLAPPICASATNASATSGSTPLHWAAAAGYLYGVRQLLAAGADVYAANAAGDTPYDVLGSFAADEGYDADGHLSLEAAGVAMLIHTAAAARARGWSPARHRHFPAATRAAIWTALVIAKASTLGTNPAQGTPGERRPSYAAHCCLYKLPNELLHLIFRFVAAAPMDADPSRFPAPDMYPPQMLAMMLDPVEAADDDAVDRAQILAMIEASDSSTEDS